MGSGSDGGVGRGSNQRQDAAPVDSDSFQRQATAAGNSGMFTRDACTTKPTTKSWRECLARVRQTVTPYGGRGRPPSNH